MDKTESKNSKTRLWIWIVVLVIFSTLVSLAFLFFWLESKDKIAIIEASSSKHAERFDIISREYEVLKKECEDPNTDSKSTICSKCSENMTCNENLPVIVYGRAGLLSSAEKEKLKNKLIDPYIAFAKKAESQLLTINVLVPENAGESYNVSAIFKNGTSQAFLFGKKDGDYDTWSDEGEID